jgi:hypothetical protein
MGGGGSEAGSLNRRCDRPSRPAATGFITSVATAIAQKRSPAGARSAHRYCLVDEAPDMAAGRRHFGHSYGQLSSHHRARLLR